MSIYRKLFGSSNGEVYYPGECVVVKLNDYVKKALIDITIRATADNGNLEHKYVGHIYHKSKRYDIVFFQSDILTPEQYEDERTLSINLNYLDELFLDDDSDEVLNSDK